MPGLFRIESVKFVESLKNRMGRSSGLIADPASLLSPHARFGDGKERGGDRGYREGEKRLIGRLRRRRTEIVFGGRNGCIYHWHGGWRNDDDIV